MAGGKGFKNKPSSSSNFPTLSSPTPITTSSNPAYPVFSFAAARARVPILARGSPPTSPPSEQLRQPPKKGSGILHTIREFFYSLVERSVEFRTRDSLPARFDRFATASSFLDKVLWYGFKLIFMVSSSVTLGCFLYSVWIIAFGDGKVSINFGMSVGFIFLFVYVVFCAVNFIDEALFFKMRILMIGLLSLDLHILPRGTKTVLVFIYSYLKWEEKLGNRLKWASVMVWFSSSFSLSSVTMLAMYGHEFAHSRTLLDDFVNVLIPLCLTQGFVNKSLVHAIMYLIPILVAIISGHCIRYLYRPHKAKEAYVPTESRKGITDIAI